MHIHAGNNCHHSAGSRAWGLTTFHAAKLFSSYCIRSAWALHAVHMRVSRSSKLYTVTFTQTHTDGRSTQRQCSAPTCADSCTVMLSGHLLCALYLHLAEFACRTIKVCAKIKSRVKKRSCHLCEIIPRCKLLRRSAWINRGMGRVKRHRYECRVHGCDIF